MVPETSDKSLGQPLLDQPLKNQKIAIFGGTFDPVHYGHLFIAQAAYQQAQLDRIIWVPSCCPPHKSHSYLLAFHHRAAMVKLAIADYPMFTISTIEADHNRRSFAINILEDLQACYPPETQWYWVIGYDAFQTLPKWYRSKEIVTQCQWLVAPRSANHDSPNMNSRQLLDSAETYQKTDSWLGQALPNLRWQLLQIPNINISSRNIRQHLQQQQSIQHLVPEAVWLYISVKDLYRTASDHLSP